MFRYLETSLALAKADFKLRNENSILGVIWYLLDPILTCGLLYLAFGHNLGQNIHAYALQLVVGIITFNYFHKTTIDATSAIINNAALIHTFPFPPSLLVISVVLKHLIGHLLELTFGLAVFVYYGGQSMFFFVYPFFLFLLVIFVCGLSLILAAGSVFVSDLVHVWEFGLRLLWLGTPIFYALDHQRTLANLNLLNPMYYFITAARELLITQRIPSWSIVCGCLCSALISLSLGFVVFDRLQKTFAERVQ